MQRGRRAGERRSVGQLKEFKPFDSASEVTGMRRATLLALLGAVLLLACRSAPSYLPLGAWSSDRELTLASYAQDPSLAKTREALGRDPTLFGQNVKIFTPHGAVAWFEGTCGEFTPYDWVLESKPGMLRYRDELVDEERIVTWNGEFMYFPLADGRAREVFRRIPVDQATQDHPCLQRALEGH
jgi:hypothetical protein